MSLQDEQTLACYDLRRVDFEGPMNCRDLGGLPRANGGITTRRRIFRSGRLSNLSDTDKARFVDLGIRQTFDLRLPFERENYPNPPALALKTVEQHFGYLPDGALDMFQAINDGSIGPDDVRAGMRDQYRSMALAHPDVYNRLFRALLETDLPCLFHCSGGKDRTGVAAAILQRIAGVSREVVTADYLLTNLDVPPLGVLQGNVKRELVAVIGFAHTELIAAALDAVEGEHASYEAFVRDAVGLSDSEYLALVRLMTG